MSSDDHPASAPGGGALTRLEVSLAASMAVVSAALSVFMPHLIATGGISSAQDFITLSPVFFPRLAFAALSILCLFYLLDAWRRTHDARRAAGQLERTRLLRGARMILIIGAYAVCVSRFGYGLSTMLMAGAVLAYLGVRQIWLLAPVAILMPVVIRFVFERLLLISLPRSDYESIAVVEDAIMKALSAVFLGK